MTTRFPCWNALLSLFSNFSQNNVSFFSERISTIVIVFPVEWVEVRSIAMYKGENSCVFIKISWLKTRGEYILLLFYDKCLYRFYSVRWGVYDLRKINMSLEFYRLKNGKRSYYAFFCNYYIPRRAERWAVYLMARFICIAVQWTYFLKISYAQIQHYWHIQYQEVVQIPICVKNQIPWYKERKPWVNILLDV